MTKLNGHRDGNGRFAAGNPGGPGRPRRAVEHEYMATLTEAVTLDDWREVVERAREDAKGGDARARQWLSDLLVGRRATTSMAPAMTEKRDSIDFRDLTNDEFTDFDNLYNRMRGGDELSADEAQMFVRLWAKSCTSAERIDEFDGEADF
jgi:hypothetical protein